MSRDKVIEAELKKDRDQFLADCRQKIDANVVKACRIMEKVDLHDALKEKGPTRVMRTEEWLDLRALLIAAREAGNHLRIHGVTK